MSCVGRGLNSSNQVLGLLTLCELASLGLVPVHILVERIDDDEPVRLAELALPEALQVVAPRVREV